MSEFEHKMLKPEIITGSNDYPGYPVSPIDLSRSVENSGIKMFGIYPDGDGYCPPAINIDSGKVVDRTMEKPKIVTGSNDYPGYPVSPIDNQMPKFEERPGIYFASGRPDIALEPGKQSKLPPKGY